MDEDHLRRVLTLQEKIGITFNDPLLGLEALTHASYTIDQPQHPTRCYERLGFLGDAILGALVAESAFRADRYANGGALTRRRETVVCGKNLERLSEELRIAQLGLFRPFNGHRLSGKGLRRCGADMIKAVIGALYLDGGMEKARIFVNRFLLPQHAGFHAFSPSDGATELPRKPALQK
jgi:ribonuclease-3